MTSVTRGQRLYFAAVGLFAAWVGFWGTFLPKLVDHALPWLVPPLHARFLGAVYFSAAVMLFGGLLARRYAEVRGMVVIVTVWTGLLQIVSCFYLGEFDFGHRPVWFWFFAYILYPLIGLGLLWRHRGLDEPAEGPIAPTWVPVYLRIQAAVLVLLALALLLAPGFMAALWPWKISPLLTQIYSAPFLAYGLGSWLLRRARGWAELRLVLAGLFVFTSLALLASVLHRGLFAAERPATWIWFGGFGLLTVILGVLNAQAFAARRSS